MIGYAEKPKLVSRLSLMYFGKSFTMKEIKLHQCEAPGCKNNSAKTSAIKADDREFTLYICTACGGISIACK